MTQHLRVTIHGVAENCGHLGKFNSMLVIRNVQTIAWLQCYYRKEKINMLLASKVMR